MPTIIRAGIYWLNLDHLVAAEAAEEPGSGPDFRLRLTLTGTSGPFTISLCGDDAMLVRDALQRCARRFDERPPNGTPYHGYGVDNGRAG